MAKTRASYEKAILHALRKNSMPTSVLADKLGQNRSAVYRSCKKLESTFGLLASRKEAGQKKLFYFPKFREVMTSENHDNIQKEIKKSNEPENHLYPFFPKVRVWRLSAKALSELAGGASTAPPVKRARLMSELPGGPTTPPPVKGAMLVEEDLSMEEEFEGDVTQEPPLGRGGNRGGRKGG